MSQNSSPNNVPRVKKGDSDSLAAPGLVGAGGTKKPSKKTAWTDFKQFIRMMFSSPILWPLVSLNVLIMLLAKWQAVMTWAAKDTPFAVVEDWSDFLGFVLIYSLGNLIDGLRCFFLAVCA